MLLGSFALPRTKLRGPGSLGSEGTPAQSGDLSVPNDVAPAQRRAACGQDASPAPVSFIVTDPAQSCKFSLETPNLTLDDAVERQRRTD